MSHKSPTILFPTCSAFFYNSCPLMEFEALRKTWEKKNLAMNLHYTHFLQYKPFRFLIRPLSCFPYPCIYFYLYIIRSKGPLYVSLPMYMSVLCLFFSSYVKLWLFYRLCIDCVTLAPLQQWSMSYIMRRLLYDWLKMFCKIPFYCGKNWGESPMFFFFLQNSITNLKCLTVWHALYCLLLK